MNGSQLTVTDKKNSTPDVSIIIPAYNEALTICAVISEIIKTMDSTEGTYEIIVIDDGSTDNLGSVILPSGIRVIRHPYNIGNGAAIKTGIRNAGGNVMVMLDADGQHPPEDIPRLLEKIRDYDMVVGARTPDSHSGVLRRFANTMYNLFASYVCNKKIEDLTSGFRAVKSNIAKEFLPLLPNTFSYPTTITLATARSGYSLSYVPIKTRQRLDGASKIKLFRDGARFLLIIFKITTIYSPMKVFMPISILTFVTGFSYGLFKIIFLSVRYGPTSAMLMIVSVLIFLIGLVSEQIAQLRLDRSEIGKKTEQR